MRKYIGLVPTIIVGLIMATKYLAQEERMGVAFHPPAYRVILSDGKTHTLRLDPLTQEGANTARKLAASVTPIKPSSTYTVTSAVPGINNFYGQNKWPVLNQHSFGTCVTFSSAAALSYLTTGTTNSVSPLYVLDQGYLDAQGFSGSGWTGLYNGGVLLQRLLPAYHGISGQNQGYYSSYDATKETYDILSKEYEQTGEQGDYSDEQLSVSGFDKQLNAYSAMATATPPTLFSNVKASSLSLSAGNPRNAYSVKQSLDRGHLVLMDFSIYDANLPSFPNCASSNIMQVQEQEARKATSELAVTLPVMGTATYKFDTSTGTLTEDTSAKFPNAWVSPTGCLMGGHQVWIISYAKDETGHLMFFIRNSWGETGDQGQYYMSDSYLNNAAYYGAQLSLSSGGEQNP